MKRCLYFSVVFILVAFYFFCFLLFFSQYKVGTIGESMTPTISEEK
ncbi:MAG: hypothetical protein NT012_03325 [Candidatus Nealsonbacteria bacterium]|nr:hypothetical protein [Candidatus Nealsonbacteria bacterium]